MLIIGFCIQLLLPFCFLIFLSDENFGSLPPFFRSKLNGILWPEYWHHVDNASAVKPSYLLKIPNIISGDILNPVAVLMTFGLCSPPLACLVAAVSVVKCSMWVWAIRRFVVVVLDGDEEHNKQKATGLGYISTLSDMQLDTKAMRSSFWIILFFSAIFIVFLYWDTVDEVGWIIPVVVSCYLLVLIGFSQLMISFPETNEDHKDGEIEVKMVSLNPLYADEK